VWTSPPEHLVYTWRSSIPDRWLRIKGEKYFQSAAEARKPSNTLQFLQQTQLYINKLRLSATSKPLPDISVTPTPSVRRMSTPYHHGPPKTSQPRRSESMKSLPALCKGSNVASSSKLLHSSSPLIAKLRRRRVRKASTTPSIEGLVGREILSRQASSGGV
jgi:hypothetical protein